MRLLELQRRMAAALLAPPGTRGRKEAVRLIKPNDRLSASERLAIYRRSYWARLLDSLAEDFPGVTAIAGRRRFRRLAVQYLRDCPSRSFTLRDLGAQLPDWLQRHPEILGAHQDLAVDMARLEWAHIVAFDGAQSPLLDPEHLLEPGPGMRIGLQPYLTLLELAYPVDEVRVALQSDAGQQPARRKAARLANPVFVAVHRSERTVYYRRLEPEEFHLLQALRRGRAISSAVRFAFCHSRHAPADSPRLLETWFAAWARLGWLTVTSIDRHQV